MMITFDQVKKTFGNGTVALDNVSFAVKPGEFVVIEGHSGAGKTTIQRLLLKDLTPSSGIITVEGDDLARISNKNLPLLRRKVGVVFQDFKILFDKTVAENILLVLDIIGVRGDLAETRLSELLTLTGLSDKGDLFPVQLSGGELQRVAIARALAPEPKVLFADEPTGNLDSVNAAAIFALFEKLRTEYGTTVVVVTHDHLLASQADRVIKLADGVIV